MYLDWLEEDMKGLGAGTLDEPEWNMHHQRGPQLSKKRRRRRCDPENGKVKTRFLFLLMSAAGIRVGRCALQWKSENQRKRAKNQEASCMLRLLPLEMIRMIWSHETSWTLHGATKLQSCKILHLAHGMTPVMQNSASIFMTIFFKHAAYYQNKLRKA